MHRMAACLLAATALLAGCAPGSDTGQSEEADTTPATAELGPTDGAGLSPTDLERVAAGDPAPDFTLASLAGSPITLSDYRGERNVVLVFYRGHW